MKCLVLFTILVSSSVFAGKAVFPDELTIKGTKLVKNGEVLREVFTPLGYLPIYTGALFLEKKETDGQKILDSPGIKVMKMGYHYDVPKDKILKAWNESFEKQCGKCTNLQPEIKKFLASEKASAKESVRTITFLKDRTVIYHNKEKLFDGGSPKLARLILATWLGATPPSEALKKGLLGLEK